MFEVEYCKRNLRHQLCGAGTASWSKEHTGMRGGPERMQPTSGNDMARTYLIRIREGCKLTAEHRSMRSTQQTLSMGAITSSEALP